MRKEKEKGKMKPRFDLKEASIDELRNLTR
jgi:hypothetical protein